MTNKLRKAAIGAVAALTLGAGVSATATPSAAQGWYGHGWHRGYWGGGWGGPVAAGVIGGLALGALAGSAYAYGPAYYNGCYWQNQPAYDAWAISPATSPSKSAIEFGPVALTPRQTGRA